MDPTRKIWTPEAYRYAFRPCVITVQFHVTSSGLFSRAFGGVVCVCKEVEVDDEHFSIRIKNGSVERAAQNFVLCSECSHSYVTELVVQN